MADINLGNFKLPDGVSRKTHFLTVKNGKEAGSCVAVAIPKTADMLAKAKKTRTEKVLLQKKKDEAKQAKAIASQRRKEILAEKKALKAELAKKRAELKAESEATKKRLERLKKQ